MLVSIAINGVSRFMCSTRHGVWTSPIGFACSVRDSTRCFVIAAIARVRKTQYTLGDVRGGVCQCENQTIEAKARALHEHIFSKPEDTYAGKPWDVVKAINDFADESRMMTFKNAKIEASRQQIAKIQPAPKTFIEFGGYVGASAIAWGAILRELNNTDSAVDVNVYTFELSPVNAGVARDLIRLAGLENTVHIFEGPAADSLKRLFEEGKLKEAGVDVAFFDHWEQFYLPDLQLCEDLGLFRMGSKVIADNTDFPGAPAYLEYVKSGGRQGGSYRYETESIETASNRGPVGSPYLYLNICVVVGTDCFSEHRRVLYLIWHSLPPMFPSAVKAHCRHVKQVTH
ncbi:S-adenosyl-L-methionine-dependent methyltransferase [Aspergillus minisclerotigenes]|uniref:catechol O-methyltransferase n=1 Tax=Aspergillus minisclerotigenes TaxID=656917 RepID=A0A5N6IZ55_9EURO|nr:S-adenosyl-L-methionine-dependent methyltransferase [Aspergillus minisclerotigenes]